ncbi:MAG TPA: hypothetical protein VJ803_04355 [Gemmatimonadaceae bacterium]|nr:hypothetical protein [Gemmatimonadaceae bacterium]
MSIPLECGEDAQRPAGLAARLAGGSRRAALTSLATLTCALPGRLTAQDTLTAQEGRRFRCDGQPVSDIRITTQEPYRGSGNRWYEAPLRWANALHETTRPAVVNRFLLLRVGEPCSERLRAESERILRVQPYLAEATVRTVTDDAGGVIVVVETEDELTPVIDVRTSGDSPYISGLELGEGNFLGSATYVAGGWRDGLERDTFEGRIIDYQFLGRPFILDVLAARRDIGFHTFTFELGHPFLTDFQRAAWRVHLGDRNDVFDFFRGEDEPVQLALRRKYVDVGGIVRVGVPGRLSLFGVSISKETGRSGLPPTREPAVNYDLLLDRFEPRENARVNAIWGVRSVGYRRVERFEGLTASQDIPYGLQLGLLFGRSLSMFGANDDDFLVAGDLYAGAGGERTFATLHARAEGRQNFDLNEWDGILASSSLTVYHRAHPRHTIVLDADWAGGWKQRIPFQLTLGDRDGGVRGYRDSRSAGARRAVVRLEDRWYVGRFRDQADLGFALFTDAGRLWAGDAPFGMATPVRMSAGLGFLVAVPPGSKRTFRVDVAIPFTTDDRGKIEVRLSTMRVNRSWREPRDVSWSREASVPASVFSWP